MAKTPLRTYNREIEAMIDRGQPSQAVNHCLHILKFFPKHIDTYRLLGKAYLELQKYNEASDVLQRVLACVPDDFISQIGMGIIREEEGSLDAAIWHMERAFEIQPSNVGVQDELRRLYEKRDGIQPVKIRLTRGALVRMYARGELYQQAIAEIRVALVEDPQRIDLETLLARMYFLSGQKVAATEVCTRLIGRLPFCFEANRILAEVLPESARAEDAKNYLQRVHAMDPYLAHLTPQTLTSAEVPDSAVEVERLEWLPEGEAGQPSEWSRIIGADWSTQAEPIPDWITGAMTGEKAAEPVPPSEDAQSTDEALILEEIGAEMPFSPDASAETPFTAEELPELPERIEPADAIPEWMQQADLQPGSGEPVATPSSIFSAEELPEEESLEPAEETEPTRQIPEWMQQEDGQPVSAEPLEEPSETFLSEEFTEEEALESLDQADVAGQLPEWTQQEEQALVSAEAAEQIIGELESEALPEEEAESTEKAEAAEQIPEWMQQAGWQPASGEVVEEPTSDFASVEDLPEAAEPEEEIEQAEIPEWLAALAPSEETEADEDNESTEWLENILPPGPAAQFGAHGDVEAIEETVFSAQPSEEETPAEQEGSQPLAGQGNEERAEDFGEFMPQEGAAPEGEAPLSQAPSSEEPAPEDFQTPDWLADLQAPEAAIESEGEVPSWLEELSLETPETTPVSGEVPADEWQPADTLETAGAPFEDLAMEDQELTPENKAEPNLDDTQPVKLRRDEQPAPEPEAAPTEEAGGEEEFDQTMSWLEELAAKETAEEEGASPPPVEESGALAPDWIPEIPIEEVEQPIPAQAETAEEASPIEEEDLSFPAEPLEEAAGVGAIFDEEFRGESPAFTEAELEAEVVEEASAAGEPGEEIFKAEEELVSEPEGEEIGGADQFLEAFRSLTPETEEVIEQPEEEMPRGMEDEFELAVKAEGADEKPVEDELPDWLRQMMASEAEEPGPAVEPDTPQMKEIETFAEPESLQPEEIEAEGESLQPEESAGEEPFGWLHELAAEEEKPAEEMPLEDTPVMEAAEPEIPGAFIEEESILKADETAEEEGLPEWLRGVDEEATAEETLSEFSFEQVTPGLETEVEEAEAEWTPEMAAAETADETEALVEDTSPLILSAEEQAVSGSAQLLKQAQSALEAHNVERALESYGTLIQSGEHLEDTIHDLRDALYRYPIDVSMWQLLGDAYMKSNRLQDALDAYNKAEELLR